MDDENRDAPDENEAFREQQRQDQLFAQIIDTTVPTWRRIFLKCKEDGFDDKQAMELTKTFILSTGPGGTRA